MDKQLSDKELKLEELVKNFCKFDLVWEQPFLAEKEPEYTKRVLLPQFTAFVDSLSDRQLTLASDGSSARPGSVLVGHAQSFYPDLSISLHGKRTIAFEVKYIGEQSYSARLATAVGQALIYTAFGYRFSHALLVSEKGNNSFMVEDLGILNEKLKQAEVSLHLISK